MLVVDGTECRRPKANAPDRRRVLSGAVGAVPSIVDADSSSFGMKPSAELVATIVPKSAPSRLEVRITSGAASSARSRSATSNPSTSGSCTSTSARSAYGRSAKCGSSRCFEDRLLPGLGQEPPRRSAPIPRRRPPPTVPAADRGTAIIHPRLLRRPPVTGSPIARPRRVDPGSGGCPPFGSPRGAGPTARHTGEFHSALAEAERKLKVSIGYDATETCPPPSAPVSHHQWHALGELFSEKGPPPAAPTPASTPARPRSAPSPNSAHGGPRSPRTIFRMPPQSSR